MNTRIIKLIKLKVIFTYSFWLSYIREYRFNFAFRRTFYCFVQSLMLIDKYRDVFITDKHNAVVEFCVYTNAYVTTTEFIRALSVTAWLCEKMKITNTKFRILDKDMSDLFESTSITAKHELPSIHP